MMKLTNYFFVAVFTIANLTYGQNQGNIWYFGNHAGLDFTNGSPSTLGNGAFYNGQRNCSNQNPSTMVFKRIQELKKSI